MNANIPSVPTAALDLDRAFRLKMNLALGLAKLTRRWDYPDKNAATSFEEMTLDDVYYWVHKCAHPITHAAKGEPILDLINTDNSVAVLPKGFDSHNTLTLSAGGDLLQSAGLENSKDVLFENVADLLFDQDISYANIESPITTQPLVKEVISNKAAPIECCSREQFDVLTQHKGKRFSVMNTANNHMFDMGTEGVDTTLKVFAEEGILDTGTNREPKEYGQGRVLIQNGIKLGFVSTTFGLNGHQMPPGEDYRINVSRLLSKFVEPELELLKKQIDHCKSQGCDFIIASLHWGFEFEFFPRQKQIDIAHTLVEWGADMVIGNHPHVIQPVEYYRTSRDPDRIAIITYSLGSLTWGFSAPHLVLSAILNCTLSKGNFRGQEVTYIERAYVTPVFRSYVPTEGKTITRIEKVSDHMDGRSKQHSKSYIAQIKQYAEVVLGEGICSDKKFADPIRAAAA